VESKLGPLGTSATEWPIVPAPGDYDDGEFGGMKIGRGNRSTRRKPAPAPLCQPQIPLDQTRARTRAAAVGSQRLTAWAVARPCAVRIATGYGLGDRGVAVRVPVVSSIFLSPQRPDRVWGPHNLPSSGYRLGSEADHSPPTSAEVMKIWIYTSSPPYAFMAQCLIS
jgi:hypothetical protein